MKKIMCLEVFAKFMIMIFSAIINAENLNIKYKLM